MATQLDLAADVREGLTATPRRLPARLFYDAEGSALFEQITDLPEYYLTRAETALFEQHADEILAAAGSGLTVVELGAGSARKTIILLRALVERQDRVTFVPVDVSPAALELAKASVQRALPEVDVAPLEGRYRVSLRALQSRPGPKLVLFIGSSIGNFDPSEAIALLRDVRAAFGPGDSLLLGTDLKKSPSVLVPAYDDAAGVTARFNLNVLARINRELGANFALGRFRHLAVWNEERSRMEMHLESTAAQRVEIPRLGLSLDFAAGERIHTENSYKFTVEAVDAMFAEAGFRRVQTWTDPDGLFGEHLAVPS